MKARIRKFGDISGSMLHIGVGFLFGLMFCSVLNVRFEFKTWQRDGNRMLSSSAYGQSSLLDLAEKYQPSKFTFSHSAYQRFYPTFFDKYRNQKVKMLEIGIDTGAGSMLWKEYFPLVDL